MIVDTLTLSAAGFDPIVLGAMDFTGGHAHGFTIDRADLSPAARAPHQQRTSLASGGVVVPGRHGIRTMTVEGRIVAPTRPQVNALAQRLTAILADRGDQHFVTVGVTIHNASGVAVPVTTTGTLDGALQIDSKARMGQIVDYQFKLVCPDPVLYSATEQVVPIASNFPGVEVTTAGEATIWPVIEVTVVSGTSTTMTIGNSTTGKSITLNGYSWGPGSVIRIVNRPGYETITRNGVNALQYRSAGDRWVSLDPGVANRLYVTDISATPATLSATATFRDGWM